jgi:hypothetical protein
MNTEKYLVLNRYLLSFLVLSHPLCVFLWKRVSLRDRLPPGRGETMTRNQGVNGEDKRQRDSIAS